MTHEVAPPKAQTPEAILSEALGWQAPHTVTEVCDLVPASTIANLAHAIDRRVYMATKDHDARVAEAMGAYMQHARESMRLRSAGWTDL